MPAARSRSLADEGKVKPRSDAYVGLLGLSLAALSVAMLFAFLNWQPLSEKPKPVQMAPAGGGGARPAPPVGGAANAPAPGAAGAQPKAQVPPPGVQAPGNAPPPGIQPQKK